MKPMVAPVGIRQRSLAFAFCAIAVAACGDTPFDALHTPGASVFLESPISAAVGQEIYIDVPGGTDQRAYVTDPNSETISTVAEIDLDPHSVYVACKTVGSAWVKVLTGNGYWKIYPLTCVLHEQGGGY